MATNPVTRVFHNRRLLAALLLAMLTAVAGLALLRGLNGDKDTVTSAADSATPYPAAPPRGPLRYDTEYPAIGYSTTEPTDPVARLQARLTGGDAALAFAEPRGYLDSLLAALEIDPASQLLVFSQTSVQGRRIRPEAPRAIYFNDDVYVAWVPGGPLEIASVDSNLGAVFYVVEQNESSAAGARFDRELTRCLSCHDSYSLTGGGVPRFITGSGYVGPTGALITHEGWILTTDRTPLRSRWGGWYVTGQHGDQVHLGNMVIRSYDDFPRLDELRVGNRDTLDGLLDTSPYLTNKSDIVALLVLEHQTNMQNVIIRLSYDARTALGASDPPTAAARARIDESVEALVRTALFVDAVELTSPIAGDPRFVEQFAARAVRDPQGRSLRDLDLTRRLFRYPLSYLVYSEAFEALPELAKERVYRRLGEVLRGEDASEDFAHLSAEDRGAILEILAATKVDLVAK